MELSWTLVIQVIADVCLFLAGFRYWRYPQNPWHHVGWIGMALWLFSLIVHGEVHAIR